MGRHASPPQPEPDGRDQHRGALVAWLERAALGLAAAVVTMLVLHWAGASAWTVALVGLAALVVVPLAAWVASTVPGAGHHQRDATAGPDDDPA